MTLDPNEIFADLISFKKEINAPDVHMNYTVNPFRFVIFSPTGEKFHIMPCKTVRTAQTNGSIRNFIRTSENPEGLKVCKNCINGWNKKFPGRQIKAATFNLEEFFGQLEYDPEMWKDIYIPPEINENESVHGFLLYRPVHNIGIFHFMKCRTVREDDINGWTRTYRFTGRTSGDFEMWSKDKDERDKTVMQKLKPCIDCLSEWDNGRGWKGYSEASDDEKKIIREKFSIHEFFEHCNHQEEMPSELSELYELMKNNHVWFGASVGNEYPGNWEDITDMYRISQGYMCEQCGVDLSRHPNLAITHHVNGSHPEIGPENMRVLCKWCHSKQYHHERTVSMNRYEYDLIRRLCKEQGIKFSS